LKKIDHLKLNEWWMIKLGNTERHDAFKVTKNEPAAESHDKIQRLSDTWKSK
jgi:hypothetical protein